MTDNTAKLALRGIRGEDYWERRDRYADTLWAFLDHDHDTDPPFSEHRIIRYVEDGKPMERFETHEEIVRAAWVKGMADWDAAHA